MINFKKKYRILTVEDNRSLREGIVSSLKKEGYFVDSAVDGKEGLDKFESSLFHLVITDIKMPKIDGIELFKIIQKQNPATDVILITAYATVDIAVDSMKHGAEDFITKPFSIAELRKKVEAVYERWASKQEIKAAPIDAPLLIGISESIKKIKAQISKVAKIDSPILITGESGTGKELIAHTIHNESFCKNGPFIAVNCGALNENLLESELFGHEKGAFTGALKTHIGKFEQSNGGTLFLDEIGEMSPALQVKLLRVLQNKHFQRVGGENSIKSNFRLITATNKDLQQALKEKSFRSDLFYRLNVIPIFIPPLRERKEDIPLLLDFILKIKSEKLNRNIPNVTPGVIRKLQTYSWPGNIRELENFIERALIFIDEDTFTDSLFTFTDVDNRDSSQIPTGDLIQTLSKMEREMIVNALQETNGVKQRAAKKLNIKTSTLYYKMEKYDVKEEEYL
ncbi:MAG: hypothetical protein DRP89_04160 [Candidatus Neomarinimicrobiota bacterium]|nr:MAG: hypothetical protein DRP89_04160 [Candidatus Neomarinimicrobiota bacterium]